MLPQQKLLLELLTMSGDIAVPAEARETILWRTLNECRNHGWVSVREINGDVFGVKVTDSGRTIIE
ncbi:MAG: hypothetical protein IH906_04235 [Proteobacteria bacterium]|nr:hypothetical protein [Pseudomonadota bacterium]